MIPQEVEVNIVSSNAKYYEDLNYEVPKKMSQRGKLVYVVNNKIKVNVEDLQKGSNIYVNVKCDYCGNKFLIRFHKHVKNKTNNKKDCCINCIGLKVTEEKTIYTYKDVVNAFEKRGFVLLETEYKGYSKYHRYICKNGHTTKITFKNLLVGKGCKECAVKRTADLNRKNYMGKKFKKRGIEIFRANRHSYEYVYNYFKEQGCELLSKEYINGSELLDYICVCGRKSKIAFYSFKQGERCRQCFIERNSGENHHNWNYDLTDEEREIRRNYPEYKKWRADIYERDKYTCQCCEDSKGGNLNSHHLDGYHWCKERRLDILNGITLCDSCHEQFHDIYGYRNNTEQQFKNFIFQKLRNQFLFYLQEKEVCV